MLIELRKYDNLGTPDYFFQLCTKLNGSGDEWRHTDVEKLFYNKIIDGRSIFDGCIPLALKIAIIGVDAKGCFALDKHFKDHLNSQKQMCDKFAEMLLLSFKEDDTFHDIFSSKYISHDIIYHSIQLENAAFTLKFANFKQLLLDFNILLPHPTPELNKLIINSRYKKLFDKVVLPVIRKRKIGVEELRLALEQKQIFGEEAEKFVLAYEKKRLNNKEGIDWVAEYSVAEGYDISSFEEEASALNDRFIEVKSYAGKPYFFWSRNEMDIARIKGNQYYLYLVNRGKMMNEGYEPIMICNPHLNVLEHDDWSKSIEKVKVAAKQD